MHPEPYSLEPYSCPLRQWCHPTISSSVIPFSYLQSFLASGSFPMSWLSASGGQNNQASTSASVLTMNIQGWFSLGLIGLISLQLKGLSSLLQHHNSNTSVLQCSVFSVVQLSHLYLTTGKTTAHHNDGFVKTMTHMQWSFFLQSIWPVLLKTVHVRTPLLVQPANPGDIVSIPGPGGSHLLQSS